MNAVAGNKKIFGNTPAKGNVSTSAPKTSGFGNFIFMKFCPPAKVYLLLAVITLIYAVSNEQGLFWLVIKAIIFIAWTFLLNKLCSSGNKAIAWLLAIVPQSIYLLVSLKSSTAVMAPAPFVLTMD